MKNFGAKTFLYPMPVLIIATYDKDGTPNAMNAAWGGICDTNKIAICIDKSHKTFENIMDKKAFTVSVADVSHVAACDYVGLVSGNVEKDKFKKAGFTAQKSQFVDAPYIAELPMRLECRLEKVLETELVIGEIINVSAEESVLTDGKIDVEKLSPVVYDPVNHAYIKLGEKVGSAFSDGKKLK